MRQKVLSALILCLCILSIAAAPVLAQAGDPPPEVVYIVQRGDTLANIAARYGSTVEAITRANSIPDPRNIYLGQRIVVPGNTAGSSDVEMIPYVFQAGDTLDAIARRYRTTWQAIAQANRILAPRAVYAGQVIQIPVAAAPTHAGLTYIVHPGDTLLRIALAHGVSPWALAAMNQIGNPVLLHPGQKLTIPGEAPSLLPAPFAAVEVYPLPVAQGDVLAIIVHTTEPVALTGQLFEQPIQFAEEGGNYYGMTGVHAFAEPGMYDLELTAVDSAGRATPVGAKVVVGEGRFFYERIDVPAGRSNLLDPDAIARDRARLDAARSTFTAQRRWSLPFQRPCVGVVSAYFGARRSYNGGPYTSYHSGVDFRAPGGSPVHAAAAGTVVLAEPLMLWGNAVVIDHGWGVLTGYAHLSSIEVVAGQQVNQGDVIAKVGNTGLSTGAHLHWEMWVNGTSVNGLPWLEADSLWPQSEWLAVGG